MCFSWRSSCFVICLLFFFFKQKTAYEMRISDWSSDVCSSDLPETWRDYSGLTIRADDPVGNARRATKTEYHHQIAKIGKPVDRGEWWMTPQTVNAVNLPLQNALNFPAAILQAPFYDPKIGRARRKESGGKDG